MTSTAIIYGPGNDRQAVPSFLSFLPADIAAHVQSAIFTGACLKCPSFCVRRKTLAIFKECNIE
jgi:hypothetical protein